LRRRGWCVDGEHRGSATRLWNLALLVADALAPVTGAAITLLVTIPQEILGRSGCSTRSPVVWDDDLLPGPEAIFLSRFVMVRRNRADEKRTDIHER
jgi:hypothetical protein